ncbi:alpha/beta fold hydrolase [Garicola koreensis]|uniref:Acyl-coenzyme A synthetase/AMP-(Fatty) acid ligase/pimeloyl-ACP methyl ester carboxylesterase n=1 Tax=Garicola koreensis TaxID=1262554 RepID=A0A7W5TU97_9MICC|nr:alpha/beta fold hydrolase [Garicola koreensis]MBB3666954.1 acyl-coenzyme A synthetase/AMP-(fatty) acid ligase/pimeloyl-ACP methyl ester carboxylesterase [Garicola koreensis]
MVSWPSPLTLWKPIPAAAARSPFAALRHTPLPGLDPEWSQLVSARTDDGDRGFHVLDTGPALQARGITPTGTILALHGNPTWSYMWRHVLRSSVEQARPGQAWRVIAPDQLDMGFSERLAHPDPPGPHATSYRGMEQRLNDLDGLMDALDVEIDKPLVTLGHDWGGVISLAWAVRHRNLVQAAMSLNTAVDHPHAEPVPTALRAAMTPGVLAGSTVLTDAFLRVTLSLAEGGLEPEVAAAYRAPYVSRLGRGGIGGFVADIPAAAEHPSREALERASSGLQQWEKPTLLVWGPKDPVFRDRYLNDLLERVPHADLHRFEGAGHLVSEDRDIAEVLFTWLQDQFGMTGPPDGTSPPPAEPPTRLHEQLEAMSLSWRRDSPAVVDMTAGPEGATLSWQQLNTQVDTLAAGLHRLGVRRGHRVSLLVQPGNSLTVVLYACLRLGAVAVVADAGLGIRGMTRAVRSARPNWVIGQRPGLVLARAMGWPGTRISMDPLSPRAARALGTVASVQRLLRGDETPALKELAHPEADDPAAILFTSGSTGPAKGVIYTHQRLGALVALLRHHLQVKPGSSLIAGFAPFALLGPAIGATSVTADMSVTKPATLTARAVAEAALTGEATMFFGSPAALRNVVATSAELTEQQRTALGRIRLVLSAGAPVHPDLLDQVAQLFPQAEIHTPYGMTEGLLQADIERKEVHRAMATGQPGVCVGRAVAGVRFALAPLDGLGRPAQQLLDPERAQGTLSELVVSAAHLKAGYDRLWLTDRQSRRDEKDDLLWHRTGDVGHIDEAGRVWIQGRLQHVITTAEGPVGPGVVETPVDALDAVARSAAVGVGPAGTQAIVVVVEPAPGQRLSLGSSPLAQPEVSRAVRAASRQAAVSAVLVVERLPTDIRHNSKIERTALAAWAEQVLAGQKVSAP